ncbi:MAG: bacterial regulatory s, tetR family protein [Gemmatimonadetes bacterium]|nr:bacterial regulatory s, tetR family protein [Gemmatimonadota bacterium]
MKVTKEKAAENRAALVRAASRLFRERGIDGVGVAEISKAAGLTHGALYGQFPSKDALVAEALAEGLRASHARLTAVGGGGAEPRLTDILDLMVSTRHRDALATGCPMTASASEIARQDETVSARFVEGFERTVGTVEAALAGTPATERRARALTIVAAQIGAIAVARAAAKSHPELSDEIIAAARRVLGEVGGEEPDGTALGNGASPG